MIIRKAVQNDVKELNNLLTLLIRDEKQYDDSINEDFVVTNMYENYIYDERRYIIVIEDNKKVVGYLYGFLKEEDATSTKNMCVIDALFILEEYRHKGLSNKLIEEFKKWAKKNKANAIEISVCSKNSIAKKLYLKHNFVSLKETLRFEIKY